MEATSLFNYRTSDFETVEIFSKRLYETARRYNDSMGKMIRRTLFSNR